MQNKENQALKFIEIWAKEKIELLTYISDCTKKVLGDKNDNEETFCLFTNIACLYNTISTRDFPDDYDFKGALLDGGHHSLPPDEKVISMLAELTPQPATNVKIGGEDGYVERNKFIDYSTLGNSKGKETVFKLITRRCSTLKRMLDLITSDIVKHEINSLRMIEYEKEINSLVIYASLLLASYHSHCQRTQKSTKTKKTQRENHKFQVWQAYVRITNDIKNNTVRQMLTENGIAKLIQERIGMKEDGKSPRLGLSQIKLLLKEECLVRNVIPPWIK